MFNIVAAEEAVNSDAFYHGVWDLFVKDTWDWD